MNKPVAIHFSNKVKRDLKKYKKTNRKLYEKIDFCIKEILKNPYYGSMKSGDLSGSSSLKAIYQITMGCFFVFSSNKESVQKIKKT